MKFIVASSLIAAVAASSLKFGVFSDIHYTLKYDPDVDASKKCGESIDWNGKTKQQILSEFASLEELASVTPTQKALLGRLGCDPPKALV